MERGYFVVFKKYVHDSATIILIFGTYILYHQTLGTELQMIKGMAR